ncbi:YodC family protein [Siccirubricoccus soli]|uniref:YodC family protein n=1 Tax=Siccirubricoccus soli TaxID=2899147 RepID=UPI00351192DF
MSFEPGDVVVLKSGGPKMTVSHIGTQYDDRAVVCIWFEDVGKKNVQKSGDFPAATLKKFERHAIAVRRIIR